MVILVNQPHSASMAFAFLHQRLREYSEKLLDVRLAHQQIECELNDIGLNLRDALRARALRVLADQRSAKHLGILRRDFLWLTRLASGFTPRLAWNCRLDGVFNV
jgi:hypothetical protein